MNYTDLIDPSEKAIAEILVASQPRGAGIDELAQKLADYGSRRTLLRRLDGILKYGWVQRIGKGRATRYLISDYGRRQLLPTTGELEMEPLFLREGEDYNSPLPLARKSTVPPPAAEPVTPGLPESSKASYSEESKALRAIVREHHSLRKMAGYRREFLDSYQPGRSSYLTPAIRQHLRAVGQSEHMAALPPGTYARQVLDRLIIDLSWNSGRLEGSTYSLLETGHLLALGKTEDPVRFHEAQMILNHKAAIEFLVELPDELGFNRHTFLNLHAILTESLMHNRTAEGALRVRPVGIGMSVYHPTSNPALIEECFDLILAKASAITDPLECCFFLMVQMPYLQPFEDGNKRTSRLAANLPLIQQNMAPFSFIGVPVREYTDGILAVYELNRIELLRDLFVWAYEQSAGRYGGIREEMGAPDPLHLRYRMEIKERIRHAVVNLLDKPAAAQAVRMWAWQNITASDQGRFIELVEEGLLTLSAGSIARVRLRPSEFEAWRPVWNRIK